MTKIYPSQDVLSRWIGRQFGRLVVRNFDHYASSRSMAWICECECGNTTVVYSSNLISGKTVSCGCYSREICPTTNWKHGRSLSRTYRIWGGMLDRCTNPHSAEWSRYGGRGISVCARWLDFRNFFDDMGDVPPGMSIDRIDNDGDYEPSNCRWATTIEQSRNTSRNRWIEFEGERLIAPDWADRMDISRQAIDSRLACGWSVEEALTIPKGGTRKRRRQ